MLRLVATVVVTAVFVGGALGLASEAEAQTTGDAVVSEAKSWMGTPYVYGGIDCSGFTSAVYSQFGVYLPDSPAAQYGYGAASNAKAGDLVFYAEGGGGITHVGIATGYGTVVHSSTYYGAVVETPDTLGSWLRRSRLRPVNRMDMGEERTAMVRSSLPSGNTGDDLPGKTLYRRGIVGYTGYIDDEVVYPSLYLWLQALDDLIR